MPAKAKKTLEKDSVKNEDFASKCANLEVFQSSSSLVVLQFSVKPRPEAEEVVQEEMGFHRSTFFSPSKNWIQLFSGTLLTSFFLGGGKL